MFTHDGGGVVVVVDGGVIVGVKRKG